MNLHLKLLVFDISGGELVLLANDDSRDVAKKAAVPEQAGLFARGESE